MRRLPLLLLLAVLLPVPAQADRHTVECFGGISPEEEQALAARVSCGFAVVSGSYAIGDIIQGALGGGTASLSASTGAGRDPDEADGGRRRRKGKTSLFLIAEGAEYIAGRDSGEALDGWMFGARGLFLGEKPVEPFIHGLVGRVRPSRSEGIAEDVVTAWTTAWAIGGGADLEINPSLHTGIVPVLRLQLDGVHTETNGWYGRVTVGLSFRFEGSGR